MEEVFLRMCVVFVSLLCLDDYTVIEKIEDDITMGMQEQKHFLHEGANLEQQVPSVAMEQPHSDQEMSQSHRRLTMEESDVQQILPNAKEERNKEHQMPPKEDQGVLNKTLLMENDLDKPQTDKTAPLSDDEIFEHAPHKNQATSLMDQNLSSMEVPLSETAHAGQDETLHVLSKENKLVSPEKKVTLEKKEFPHIVQDVDTVNDINEKQTVLTMKQKPSEEGRTIHKDRKAFFQKIYEFLHLWSQTFNAIHPPQDDESVKDSKESQTQVHESAGKIIKEEATVNRRHSRVDQGEPLDVHEPMYQGQVQGKAIQNSESDNDYTWYLWKVLSLMSLIRLLRKFFSRGLKTSGMIFPIVEDKKKLAGSAKLSLPDHDILNCFYEQCVRTPPSTCERECEFVEGFVDELLEVMRKTSNKETDMQIEDFVGVGSLYELWATGKRVVCDLYVPFIAPRSYGFEFWKENNGATFVGACGKIKIMKTEITLNGCPCSSGNMDDTLCLLHPHNDMNSIIMDATGGPLCQENTPYLSKAQVVRWFRVAVRKAWGNISHKYDFELTFRNQTAPGALKVRFRSGRVILFNITPVVQVKGSKVNLVSYLPSNQRNLSDIDWPVSFALYENDLLQQFNKTLPNNPCHIKSLQILSFLHKQQIKLTGNCGLTSYHLKTALLHLLLVKKPVAWESEQLPERLIDMFTFIEQRLQARKLEHSLVGNPLIPHDIGLPKEFHMAQSINLFLPLVSNIDSYTKTVRHLQELMRNAPVLIHEYTSIKHATEQMAKAAF